MEPRVSIITLGVENLDRAAQFYETMGFTLAERRVGAVDDCRERYKPSIPPGIHDELEYVVVLDDPTEEPR